MIYTIGYQALTPALLTPQPATGVERRDKNRRSFHRSALTSWDNDEIGSGTPSWGTGVPSSSLGAPTN
jgi:hypothetical protein